MSSRPLARFHWYALENARRITLSLFRSLTFIGSAILIFLYAGCTFVQPESRQEHIHHMGSGVMPFDLSKTTHVFQMTEEGGIQRVLVKDPADSKQVALVQQHLQHEAERFQKGDFSDPAVLHGEELPGLRELAAGAARLTVTYASFPNGAEITFATRDIRLVTAVHQWFGAQLSEHGADATYR